MCTYLTKVPELSTTYLYSLIPCHAKWNKKKHGRLDWHDQCLLTRKLNGTLTLLMAFLKLPLHLRCLLIAFGVLYVKKGPELCFLLPNERFGEKKILATKTYGDQATEMFLVTRQLVP